METSFFYTFRVCFWPKKEISNFQSISSDSDEFYFYFFAVLRLDIFICSHTYWWPQFIFIITLISMARTTSKKFCWHAPMRLDRTQLGLINIKLRFMLYSTVFLLAYGFHGFKQHFYGFWREFSTLHIVFTIAVCSSTLFMTFSLIVTSYFSFSSHSRPRRVWNVEEGKADIKEKKNHWLFPSRSIHWFFLDKFFHWVYWVDNVDCRSDEKSVCLFFYFPTFNGFFYEFFPMDST